MPGSQDRNLNEQRGHDAIITKKVSLSQHPIQGELGRSCGVAVGRWRTLIQVLPPFLDARCELMMSGDFLLHTLGRQRRPPDATRHEPPSGFSYLASELGCSRLGWARKKVRALTRHDPFPWRFADPGLCLAGTTVWIAMWLNCVPRHPSQACTP